MANLISVLCLALLLWAGALNNRSHARHKRLIERQREIARLDKREQLKLIRDEYRRGARQ